MHKRRSICYGGKFVGLNNFRWATKNLWKKIWIHKLVLDGSKRLKNTLHYQWESLFIPLTGKGKVQSFSSLFVCVLAALFPLFTLFSFTYCMWLAPLPLSWTVGDGFLADNGKYMKEKEKKPEVFFYVSRNQKRTWNFQLTMDVVILFNLRLFFFDISKNQYLYFDTW